MKRRVEETMPSRQWLSSDADRNHGRLVHGCTSKAEMMQMRVTGFPVEPNRGVDAVRGVMRMDDR